ncbi:hypothetical protein BOX15_Mlig000018g1 [Macrostomum lignano]|uniref:Uncharacterized protein n=1 Tax=Macrostomum lignano TaxID=282301 RepID=A0A267DDA8_9PLAT|nr:hypothetical protein BOX15_Mlig000018g1 [Macrostomum lignano]
MALPPLASVCYSTNTNEDHNRLQVLCKRLKKMCQADQPDSQLMDALVATALTDDRAAAHWLVNHAEDPSLVSGNCRVYYLLLCPANELEARFDEFWTAYRGARDWTPPMDYMPHVPVVQPFEAQAHQLLDVYHAFNTVSRGFADRCPAADFQLTLPPVDLTANPLRLSLQLCEPTVETMLKELAAVFVKMLADKFVPAVPVRPPYRAALCEGFMQSQQYQVEQEAMHHFAVNPDSRRVAVGTPADTVWQLRLYSRDVRQRNDLTGETHAVYRMRSECLPADDDGFIQLAYSSGDLVALVAPTEPGIAPADVTAWALGLNCDTGQLGHFRPAMLEAQRVPCSSAWTLHKVANIGCTLPSSPLGNSASSSCWASFSRQSSMCVDECASATGAGCSGSGGSSGSRGYCGANGSAGTHCPMNAANRLSCTPSGVPLPPSDTSGSSDSMPPSPKPVGKSKSLVSFFLSERPPRQLHVMRHGERMDTTVGFHWYNKAFDSKGVFANRFDLNIPEVLPTRPVEDFDRDTPLTLIGQFVSHQMGEALARAGVRYTYAYSSPALRCVQTAHHLLQGAGQFRLSVRIEPMLNEFPHDHDDQAQMPRFMSPTELRSAGYNVDKDYQPHSTLEGFDRRNSPEKYQQRVRRVLKKILDSTRKRGGNILVVGHRTTIEFCPIILMGYKSYVKRVCIPYNAMLCLDERPKKGTWVLANQPSAAFSCNEHCRFDGSSLASPV